ncbi:hypothetical protein V1477_006472 [Vespula maculifrons]|uniref:Uncharacterized protein n=1 Tax=Vespula maculifrons TaxID=7453 RepID=A0ABD2BQE5_VESMC
MFETDGVDGGAICKRGFIHLQFAEKPEAPEAERHLDLNVKWGYTASTDDNNIGSLADLYSSWFSSALDIDE